ncbi:hypothetical protein IPN35_00510 [Candidatus Peregrinibacteria bacterium]|nr:MAG: hypothetical protein IPN35_00510 [Candidatus Peregrinibacteria bacterium]
MIIALLSFGAIFYGFYRTNTDILPAPGGEITEGMVGAFPDTPLFSPLFATKNIEQDVTHLVFAGLMRYNPETEEIEDYLGTHTLSPDKTTYEFTLHENIFWHDGHPVSADDVVFTFRDVIQNKDFPNTFLKSAFSDVTIEKIDERSVRFTVPEKRKTFFTNFTVGIVPRHLLAGIPVNELLQDSFQSNPIGCGPYRFEGTVWEPNFTQVRLTAFPNFFRGRPAIDSVVLRTYPSLNTLLDQLSELDAIRPLQTRESQAIPSTPRMESIPFYSPQYIAIFFNLQNETLTTKTIRQAIRAAIDTDQIAQQFQGTRQDTPLVELWPQNDIVNLSKNRADELMRSAGYFFPQERVPSEVAAEVSENNNTEQPEEEETPQQGVVTTQESSNEMGQESLENPFLTPTKYIYEPFSTQSAITGESAFYIVGSFPKGTASVAVNGYDLRLFNTASGRFSYRADAEIGTLKEGENKYEIHFFDVNKKVIDTEVVSIIFEPDTKKRELIREKVIPTDPIVSEGDQVEQEGASEETAVPEETVEETPSDTTDTSSSLEEPEKSTLFRTNDKGGHIRLELSYLESFDYLKEIAEIVRDESEKIGVEVVLSPESPDSFREKIRSKTYELLLLPQHLGYNLDAYPYFHLSQVGENGFNYSNWKNLEASILLEEIRTTHDIEKRRNSLLRLRDIIIDEVPAIFLYTPEYVWIFDKKIKNVTIKKLPTITDRYGNISSWYIREGRQFSEGRGVSDFFPWFWEKSKKSFSFFSQE